MHDHHEYRKILVATDFQPASDAALQQAIWLARRSRARLTIAHVVPALQQTLLLADSLPRHHELMEATQDYQQELQDKALESLERIIDKLQARDLDIECRVVCGQPYIALIRVVQEESHDLVILGTRNDASWEHFVLGSTAKRMIRNCPSSVWAAKSHASIPPRTILAATDFSAAGNHAVLHAARLAKATGAKFHVAHILDLNNLPDAALERLPSGWQLRETFRATSIKRIEEIVNDCGQQLQNVFVHASWGLPGADILALVQDVKADLLALGTVGRSGIAGLLLGNTAERLLDQCHCSILTVKPDDYISPIQPIAVTAALATAGNPLL